MEQIIEKRSRNVMQFVLICIYIVLTLSGLTLMKLGGNAGTIAIENGKNF